MAKKKPQKYNDLVRMIAEMENRKAEEKDRMAKVMCSALDDESASLLGELSDADLRRVTVLLLPHIKELVDQIKGGNRDGTAGAGIGTQAPAERGR